ncbi:MAG: hypothetical protein [Inoviridae sp.]|nr:MAG: hypothetical protein [Inoviridae sp.]
MSEITVFENKRAKRSKLAAAAVGVVGVLGAPFAMAAPDSAAIVTAISGVETTIDAVGSGMVTVFVGLMVFGIIISMIARKGK